MKISAYCVQVFHGSHEDESGMVGQEFHTQKGMARQLCQASATMGREAILHQVEVEAEPREILVAGLSGTLEDEYVSSVSLETYTPTTEMKLAPGMWAYEVVEHEEASD